ASGSTTTGRLRRHLELRPEALTGLTTSDSRPWCGSGCWSSGELRDRDLADNTIHGFFEVLRAFASWADREGYPVDPALLRVRAPKVAQKEVGDLLDRADREDLRGGLGPAGRPWRSSPSGNRDSVVRAMRPDRR